MEKKIRRRRQIFRNRTIILRSAKELFHKKGFYSTTMEDIAQFSGFDRRTIYNHFKNKDEIFAALIATLITDMKEIIEAVSKHEISPLYKLKEIIGQLLSLYSDHSQLLTIFMSEYEVSGKKKKKQISPYMLKNILAYREIETLISDLIKQAQAEDLIADIHPYILAGVFNELILRSVVILHSSKKDFTKEDAVHDIVRVIGGNILKNKAVIQDLEQPTPA